MFCFLRAGTLRKEEPKNSGLTGGSEGETFREESAEQLTLAVLDEVCLTGRAADRDTKREHFLRLFSISCKAQVIAAERTFVSNTHTDFDF